MAYNPFNIFRRNQKALFAVLTVFIMIMFTLSSGVAGGDFFDTFARWLRIKGNKEAVCKIDGQNVTLGDLEGEQKSVRSRRIMANRFMSYAANQSIGAMMEYADQQKARLSDSGKKMAEAASEALSLMSDPMIRSNPQARPFVEMRIRNAIVAVRRTIEAPGSEEDRFAAQTYLSIFNLLQIIQGGGEHYFLNVPNKTRPDLIEFVLWEKKADQLGIKFTQNDVKRLIQLEFGNSFKNDVPVRQELQKMQGFSMDACYDALASEFKVRAAQTVVLGYSGRFGRAPAFTTPYETFEYYREQTSPAIYEVISVPAAGFIHRVPETPSESQIKELYRKHADDEPNPRKETPGFKEPRKIAVEWFGVTGEEPYYKKLAEEQIKIGEVMAKASGALTVPLPGALNSWGATASGALRLKEPAVDAAYNRYAQYFKGTMENHYQTSNMYGGTRDILEAHWAKPGTAAAAVGAFVGQSAGMGNPSAAAAMTMAAPIAYEQRARVAVGTPLVLGLIPGPSLVPTIVGASAMSAEREPKPLPIESQKPELLKSTIEKRAKTLAFGERPDPMAFAAPKANPEKGDLEKFIEELEKKADADKTPDKAETKKYIADFLAARGIAPPATGKSTGLRDEWSLEEDPGLAPLVKAQKDSLMAAKGPHGSFGGLDQYIPFGRSFFWTEERSFSSGQMQRKATTKLYKAEQYPASDRSISDGRLHYVVWRTEDKPAKRTTESDARESVISAWRKAKAREQAKARADALADEIRKKSENDPTLLMPALVQRHFELQNEMSDPKVRAQVKRFTVNGVAPFVTIPGNPMMGQRGGLMQYQLPDSENIPFSTAEMEKLLLENRDKSSGTVLVFPDAAKDVYYVATLMRRDLKIPSDFNRDVYSEGGSAQQIRGYAMGEAIRKSHESVLELLKKEFKYEVTDDQKKKLEENAKSGGRDDF